MFTGQPRALFQDEAAGTGQQLPGQVRLLRSQPVGSVSVHQDLRFLDDEVGQSLLEPRFESKVKKVAHDALAMTGWQDKRVANITGNYAYEMFTKDYPAGTPTMDIATEILQAYQEEFRVYKPQGGRPRPELWQRLVFELHLTISANHQTVNFAFEVPVFEQ